MVEFRFQELLRLAFSFGSSIDMGAEKPVENPVEFEASCLLLYTVRFFTGIHWYLEPTVVPNASVCL